VSHSDTGTVAWNAFCKPFGEAVVSVSMVENPFRFPGQYYDQETGLHYNWNRYYDPNPGRYLTSDRIGLEGGLNLYLYVGSNPIITHDALGLFGDGINAGGGKWHGHNDLGMGAK
jgi:RHS repeat-associated protein